MYIGVIDIVWHYLAATLARLRRCVYNEIQPRPRTTCRLFPGQQTPLRGSRGYRRRHPLGLSDSREFYLSFDSRRINRVNILLFISRHLALRNLGYTRYQEDHHVEGAVVRNVKIFFLSVLYEKYKYTSMVKKILEISKPRCRFAFVFQTQ